MYIWLLKIIQYKISSCTNRMNELILNLREKKNNENRTNRVTGHIYAT